jgi:phage portal protein BeeE
VHKRSLTRWIARVAQEVAGFVTRGPVVPAADDYTAMFQTLYGTPNMEKILPTFEQFSRQGYSGNGVIFGLANKRLHLFSEARFCFRNLEDGKLDRTHPALAKLNDNPWLKPRMEQDGSLAGNCYIRDCGDDELERLRPDWVTIVSSVEEDAFGREIRRVIGYAYEPLTDPERRVEFYTADEVAHYAPLPDPLANWRGVSWLTPVVKEINADTAMSEHAYSYFMNAATPNLIIKYAQKLGDTSVKRISDMIRSRHTGSENAFSTLLLDMGADPMIVGSQLTDVSFTALQAAGENRIAVAAGVPAIVAGLKEGLAASTLANYREALESFADLTMRPLWRAACASLARIVEVPQGWELWYDTTDVSALQQGEKETADTLQVQAATVSSLISAGYEPESVIRAVVSGDLTLLKHTGLYSVQLRPPGADDPAQGQNGGPGATGKRPSGAEGNKQAAAAGEPGSPGGAKTPAAAARFNATWTWDIERGKWTPELHPRDEKGRFRKIVGADLLEAIDVKKLSDRRLLGIFGDLSTEPTFNEHAARKIMDELERREQEATLREARKANPLAGHDLTKLSDGELVDLQRAHPADNRVLIPVKTELRHRRELADAEARARPLIDWDVHQADTLEQRRIDKAVAAGADYLSAYADAYKLSDADLRQQERASLVDLDRRAGETRRQAVRRAYGEWVNLQYIAAEDATRGNVLNAAGQAKGLDPVSLFSGPARTARKYASEELLRWWQDNGRTTYAEFEAAVLTGDTSVIEAGRLRGNDQEFGV